MTPEQLAAEGFVGDDVRHLSEFLSELDRCGLRQQIRKNHLDERVLFAIHQHHRDSQAARLWGMADKEDESDNEDEEEKFPEVAALPELHRAMARMRLTKTQRKYRDLLDEEATNRAKRMRGEASALRKAAWILREWSALRVPFEAASWFASANSGMHEDNLEELPILIRENGTFFSRSERDSAPIVPSRVEAAEALRKHQEIALELQSTNWQGVAATDIATWEHVLRLTVEEFFPSYVRTRAWEGRALWELPVAVPREMRRFLREGLKGDPFLDDAILSGMADTLFRIADQIDNFATRPLGRSENKRGPKPAVMKRSFVEAFTAYAQSVAGENLEEIGAVLYSITFPPAEPDEETEVTDSYQWHLAQLTKAVTS